MRALTIWQPWAHLVANGDKLIENRPWEPPAWIVGKPFAIHAGKHWDKKSLDFINDIHGIPPGRSICVSGAVIGIATTNMAVASAEEAERRVPGHGKWFVGPFGWVLRDVRLLETPVPCKGYQKLWNLTAEQDAEVVRQLEAKPK